MSLVNRRSEALYMVSVAVCAAGCSLLVQLLNSRLCWPKFGLAGTGKTLCGAISRTASLRPASRNKERWKLLYELPIGERMCLIVTWKLSIDSFERAQWAKVRAATRVKCGQ